jgi:hypothetical protein
MKLDKLMAAISSGFIVTEQAAASDEKSKDTKAKADSKPEQVSKAKFMSACKEIAKEDEMDAEETKTACDKAYEQYQAEFE